MYFSLRVWNRFVVLALALVMTSTITNAATITINDLTDTIGVTTTGSPTAISIQPDSTNEFLHFLYTSAQLNSGSSFTNVVSMLEPTTQAMSDLFIITVTNGSAVLEVGFYSDPHVFPTLIPTGPPIVENGTAQLVTQYFGGSPTVVDQFFAISDVTESGDVPEPGTALLMVTGFLVITPLWRRALGCPLGLE